MNKKQFNSIFLSCTLALLATVGSVQAMETTEDDTMMKKDDVMMKEDTTMKKADSAMMEKDAMMTTDGAMTMSVDLSFGSRGIDVVTFQTFLESKGLLTMPAGVAKGYFGSLTQSALMKYQASVDVPATGYFGPITRGVISNMMMKKGEVMMKEDTMMKKDDAAMMKKDAMMKKEAQ